jgi:hypothetical protein
MIWQNVCIDALISMRSLSRVISAQTNLICKSCFFVEKGCFHYAISNYIQPLHN